MGVFLIIILIIALLWPWIMRWMRAYMMRKAEERLRAMMGMPPRQEEERRQRRERERQQRPESNGRRRPDPHPARAMREVAEDVRYTEYFDYSETSVETDGEGSARREYHERQVEDVKFTEIKTGKK